MSRPERFMTDDARLMVPANYKVEPDARGALFALAFEKHLESWLHSSGCTPRDKYPVANGGRWS